MVKKSKSIPPKVPNGDNPPKVPNGDNNDTGKEDRTREYKVVSNRNQWLGIGAVVLLVIVIIILGFYSSNIKSELATTTKEKQKTAASLEKTQKDLKVANEARDAEKNQYKESQQALEEQLADLESALQNARSRVGNLRDEKRQALRAASQFKRFSKQFQRMIDSGKLEVDFRQGRMVVNLPAQVLFDSGSAELTEDGGKALREVARVLKTVRNKRFLIGGHTDNQKIKKASFDTNWELASARAIVVTKELIKAGMSPKNLVAAGYSQYAPIASNQTELGRQKNRRIEIILEPFLKDIPLPKRKTSATASKTKSKAKKSKVTASKTKSKAKKSKVTASKAKAKPTTKNTTSAARKSRFEARDQKTAERRKRSRKKTPIKV